MCPEDDRSEARAFLQRAVSPISSSPAHPSARHGSPLRRHESPAAEELGLGATVALALSPDPEPPRTPPAPRTPATRLPGASRAAVWNARRACESSPSKISRSARYL